MRTGGFRFAVVLSLAFAAAAVAVAVTYHLPLRDPDGVAVPTYVPLPGILLLAFLTHVVPRAAWRGRPLVRVPPPPFFVGGGRWAWRQTTVALVGAGGGGLPSAPV